MGEYNNNLQNVRYRITIQTRTLKLKLTVITNK